VTKAKYLEAKATYLSRNSCLQLSNCGSESDYLVQYFEDLSNSSCWLQFNNNIKANYLANSMLSLKYCT